MKRKVTIACAVTGDSRCDRKHRVRAKGLRSISIVTLISVLILQATPIHALAPLTEHDVSREFGYVPMRDGVRLAYVVWRLKKASRLPVVLHYSPYASGGASFEDARRFLEAGYAFIGANIRGTGCSEGVDTEGGGARVDTVGRDGAQVVEWVAVQPWSTGNVGMVGNSYAAALQFAVAANNPPHLKAITASGISTDDYHESFQPGGMTHLGGLAAWTLSIQGKASRSGQEARLAAGDRTCEAILAKQQPVTAYWDAKAHPLYDDWWEARSARAAAGRITVPTLIMTGWHDEFNFNAGTLMFNLLKSAHKKIILQNGGHGVGAPERRGYGMDHQQAIRWLDRWVKGVNNGIDTEEPVTVYWEVRNAPVTDGSGAEPGWTTRYASWPAPQTRWDTFYLTVDGELSPVRPTVTTNDGARKYLYPTGTELPGSNEQFAVVPYELGTLNYRTAPMSDDVTILGFPRLHFAFSSEQNDTDFMVTLKDIDTAGNTLYLQRTFLRASLRAVDPTKSTPYAVVQSYRKAEALVPGQMYDIELSIPAIGHVVRKGHRLELSILAPSAIPAPVMGGVPLALPSVNQVFHAPRYASTLTIPVIPGEHALREPPECGSLQFQPCRRALTAMDSAH